VDWAAPARLRLRAAKLAAAGLALAGVAGVAAGCSSQPAVTAASETSCYQFAAGAIQRHVTVTTVPAACRGLSQVDVNVAVGRALQAAAAGAPGKVRRRELIARESPYVDNLIRAIPVSSQPAVAVPQSSPPGRAALSLAALLTWLVTVGLGVSMMARWVTRVRRHGSPPRRGRGPVLNFTHFGLAVTGLLTWISYLATGVTGLAWAGCGLLLAAASLGITLVFLATARAGDGPPPARGGRVPVLVVAAHITMACVTILLATLAAIGSG
jgi:hypothetical protein